MNLPDLPRQYKRKEADITPLILQWFLENYPYDVAIEVKMKGRKPLPHQELALNEVKEGRFSYKIPDMGRKNPFDGVVLKHAHPFVVVCKGMTCEATNLFNDQTFTIELKTAKRRS